MRRAVAQSGDWMRDRVFDGISAVIVGLATLVLICAFPGAVCRYVAEWTRRHTPRWTSPETE